MSLYPVLVFKGRRVSLSNIVFATGKQQASINPYSIAVPVRKTLTPPQFMHILVHMVVPATSLYRDQNCAREILAGSQDKFEHLTRSDWHKQEYQRLWYIIKTLVRAKSSFNDIACSFDNLWHVRRHGYHPIASQDHGSGHYFQ
jgi:hypothetical protein